MADETGIINPGLRGAEQLVTVARQYFWLRRVGKFGENLAEDLTELEKLNTRLGREELASVFDSSLNLKPEVVNASKALDLGKLNNPDVIKALEADGSKISDWRKMACNVTKGLDGKSYDIHFYKNIKTGATNFGIDYSALVGGKVKVPISELLRDH